MTTPAPPNPWNQPLLTLPEAAALMGISRAGIYRCVAAGTVPTITFAGVQRVRTVDLMAVLGLPVPALESA